VPLEVRVSRRGGVHLFFLPLLLEPFSCLLLWVNAEHVLLGLLHDDRIVDAHTVFGKPIVLPVPDCECVSEKLLEDEVIIVGDVLIVQ
jgi:hypothetical protein